MGNKILKGSIIAVMIIMSLILISTAASANNDTNSEQDVLTLSKGGISITYPSNWGYSESTSNYSIMAISKLDSIDPSGVGQISINFEKKPLEGDFTKFLEDTYKTLESDSSFELVSSGEVAIGDRVGVEYIYISNQTEISKEHKAVWFEKGGQAYVMLYSAPVEQFESNLHVFDYILSNVEIT